MENKYYIVGNWKMNQSLAEIDQFFTDLDLSTTNDITQYFGVAPQGIHQSTLIHHKNKPVSLHIGSQNCSEFETGAYTGEFAPAHLKELGADFTLIGHSERRVLFGENCNHTLGKKIKAALGVNLKVIYCVGETLEERKAEQTKNVLKNQIYKALADIKIDQPEQLLIAYEPVWAIGTGETATPEQAQEAHAWIQEFLKELPAISTFIPILYGGSVKPNNIKDLLTRPEINGALVGGASLKGDSFTALCHSTNLQ